MHPVVNLLDEMIVSDSKAKLQAGSLPNKAAVVSLKSGSTMRLQRSFSFQTIKRRPDSAGDNTDHDLHFRSIQVQLEQLVKTVATLSARLPELAAATSHEGKCDSTLDQLSMGNVPSDTGCKKPELSLERATTGIPTLSLTARVEALLSGEEDIWP